MKIGIIVLCRYNSSRLPGKALLQIDGRSVLQIIIDRLRKGASGRPIVVATSDQISDEPIARFCEGSGIPCFRGSLENVSERFLRCAEHWEFDYAVRINGDNLFTDPETLQMMLATAETGEFDFISNVPGRTFPYGMSIEVVKVDFYSSCFLSLSQRTHREHVTSWLYENPSVGRRYVFENTVCPEAAGLKLALDTPEDLDKTRLIFARAQSEPKALDLRRVYELATS